MNNELRTKFYLEVIAAYDLYAGERDSSAAGLYRHRRTALEICSILYHFREHLPESLRPRYRDVVNNCPSYELIRGVSNASKHSSVSRNNPLVLRSEDITEMVLVDRFQRLEPSVSCSDDFVGVGLPDEGFGVCGIVFANETVDGGLEIDKRMEDAVLEPPARELCEEALDGIEP